MPIMLVDMRTAHWGGSAPGSFQPQGKVVWSGPKTAYEIRDTVPNPTEMDDVAEVSIPAIRFFIGFSVGSKPRWKMDDLVRIVKRVRTSQGANPDATFVAQTGMYSYRDKTKNVVVTEKGAQLVILNMPEWGVPEGKFRKQMQELGEALCRLLKQELIIGEWQINGLVKQTWKVTP